MSDFTAQVWANFFAQRTKPLQSRFSGLFRAVVVETNDPLRMRRVRFKIPELHDHDLKPEMCPWAVPSTDMGDKRCGRFTYPCIGDWIWIGFEKGHPYGPVYTGFASPTRRKFYPLSSICGVTQIPVDENSDEAKRPNDFDPDYLPKDERPMSHGWQDRYGNLDQHDSTGFFPIEHKVDPPPPDADPFTKSKFTQSVKQPVINDPDSKMMFRLTKYGMMVLQSDVGYKWHKDDTASPKEGEFEGDFDKDEEFEIKRWLYMQRVLHEDSATGHDQRRTELLTRYGSKFEMRDVGWNKTREKEWLDDKRVIGDGDDERWTKIRTKGGMLMQAIDIGFDPENDEFIKRLLIDEAKNVYLDSENTYPKTKSEWNQYGDRDMRMLRFVTRSGLKMALDDRGSHDGGQYRPPFSASAASRLNEEIGIGIMFKGRATPGTVHDNYPKLGGNPRGYYWQFDERPDHNSTTWGTPMGAAIEMDDNDEFLVMCSRLPALPTEWKYLADNEFLTQSVKSLDPANTTHHLIIDHGREVVRLKSRAGFGDPSRDPEVTAASGTHAGVEIHDAPQLSPWTEIVDIDNRGIWFSRQDGVGIWRGKDGSNIYLWLDDKNNNIVLRNATAGKVQIYCQGNVEVISDQVIGMRANQIQMSANEIRMQAGGHNYTFGSSLKMNGDIYAPRVFAFFPTADTPAHVAGKGTGAAAPGGEPVSNLTVVDLPGKQQPDDRL